MKRVRTTRADHSLLFEIFPTGYSSQQASTRLQDPAHVSQALPHDVQRKVFEYLGNDHGIKTLVRKWYALNITRPGIVTNIEPGLELFDRLLAGVQGKCPEPLPQGKLLKNSASAADVQDRGRLLDAPKAAAKAFGGLVLIILPDGILVSGALGGLVHVKSGFLRDVSVPGW